MQRFAYLLVFGLLSLFAHGQKTVTQGEYFWDTDPGAGNGTSLTATDGNFDQVIEEVFQNGIDVSALSVGAHSFNVRLKGFDGTWSNVFKTIVYIEGPNLSISQTLNITQGEYFWDTDPGQGNGITLLALDGNFDQVIEEVFQNGIDVSALSVGAHSLNVRVKGQDGTWSNVFKYIIYIEGPNLPLTQTLNVTQGEYFWDTDPGQGNGSTLLALNGGFNEVIEEVFQNGIDVSALSVGAHSFNVRVKGQDGTWSNVFKYIIYTEGPNLPITRISNVIQAEYFWDLDPGQGNASPLLALDGNLNETIEDVFQNGITVGALSTGAHSLNVRVKGQDGTWSNVFKYIIYTEGPNTAITRNSKVIQAEYYWDADPGQGNGLPLLVSDGNFDEAIEDVFQNNISTLSLTQGAHNFSVRVKGEDGTWSNSFKYTIYLEGPNVEITRNARIIQGEYYWDTDPGQGGGLPLLATDGNFNTVIENLMQDIDASTLAVGPHSLGVRTKGFDGQWSPVFRQTIYVECVTPTAPSITISVAGNGACMGSTVQFTATTVNGGTAPIFQWKLNGSPVGTNSASYSNSSLVDGDIVSCDLTSNSTCATTPNASSNNITITLAPTVTPTISIAAAPGNSNCYGTLVTFTASVTNEGSSPIYQWKINGLNSGSNSSTFSTSTLQNGDVVTCSLTSNATCSSPITVVSTGITMNISSNLTPSVSISTPSTTVCSGSNATFTATPTNGGLSPSYQWYVNGLPVGTNSNTFTSASLTNGNTVSCTMTSSETCLTNSTATSNVISISVPAALSPTVAIAQSPSGTICLGTSISFTATVTNGGSSQTYQWYVNGAPVGTNSANFATNSLVNSDVVSCVVTSNSICESGVTTTSNSLTQTITTPVTPSVTISTSSTTICAGTTASFTATPVNGGSANYQWSVNGTIVASGSATFNTSTLSNGDVISCEMFSSLTCVTASSATSNSITITVNPTIATSIVIAANPGSSICAGTPVTFTATPTNGGTPTYQWQVNGANVGTNSDTYTTSTLANGNTVRVLMNSSLVCPVPASATSNTITMTVTANVTPTATISASPSTTICAGTNVTFTASGTNLGATPTYQWYLNGTPVGSNSPTYSNNSLTNGNTVNCVITSSVVCVTSSTATSNTVTMTVNTPVTPAVSISASTTTICAGSAVTFTATPTNGGTPTYQWKLNGSNVGTNSTTYSSSTLANGDVVTCVLTSSLSCVTSSTATSNAISITVNPLNPTSATIVANPGTSICAGTPVTFTATPTNGGTTPSYQWQVNGTNVGTNSDTYTSSTLANGNTIRVLMTSNISCPSPATATSNVLTMTVTANVTPSVSIARTPTGTICAGTNVTFTATPTNGGATPSYQWKINGSNVGTNSATFSSTTLANGDIVTCVLTSSLTCVTSATATSNALTMAVTTPVTPAVSITASSTTICAGTSITFTATPTNGGTPTYQWKLNGTNVGTNSATYSSSTLVNGDVITCVMTSTVSCVTATTATSNAISITVNPINATAVTISANPGSTICAGSSVTFTATPTNGGTPTYQWQVNGTNVGTNSDTYTSSTLVNGNTVRVLMTSSLGCTSPATATSNVITMTVTSNVTPSVSITRTPTGTICVGTNVTFTATPTNGGATPSYQWKVNGSNVGTNSATFSATTLANGDIVTCVLTSSLTCVTSTTATSNALTMTVTTPVTPAVSISASSTTICSGTNVTFTATPTNGGTPTYQWLLNGSPVGTNSSTFSSTTLANNDVITCTMTSSNSCVTSSTATSNAISMTVSASFPTSVSIAANPGSTICTGTSVTFTATPTNGGATPIYQWYLNGSPVGTNSATYTNTALSNGNVVACQMTSSFGCASPAIASNSVTMTVNAIVTPAVTVSPNTGTTACGGSVVTFTATPTNEGATPSYQWYLNGSPVGTNSTTYTNSSLVSGDNLNCVVTSSLMCLTQPTGTSNTVTMTITTPLTPAVSISASASSICVGSSVTFTATPTNGGTPSYQWYRNGSPVGSNSSTYTTSSLNNNDVINCIMTSSISCVTSSTATSNSITMTVNPYISNSVSISSSTGSTSCYGSNVVFTATPVNGGGTPSYIWYVNGTPVWSGSPFVTSSLTTGDVVICEMSSSVTCPSPSTATSNSITMTVYSTSTPTASISSNQGAGVCSGGTVNFTATGVNIGTSPSYQWYLNGAPVGTNSSSFSITNPIDGNTVNCVITSNSPCVSGQMATSNTITINVVTPVTPTVSISTASTTVCSGASVTFNATSSNGGTPDYQWFKNGSPVGFNSSIYTTSSLNNGDVISCTLTSSLSCVTSSTANSNSITMTVSSSIPASVSITSSASSICFGTSVSFTATPTNGGATPSYQWYLNGSSVGSNANSYSSSTLTNGDVVSCNMSSSIGCASPTSAPSNSITMTVFSTNSPTASITSDLGSGVCIGGIVNFTASGTNIGGTPTYQWYMNGSPVGTNSSTYSVSNPSNGNSVYCVITSSASCVLGQTGTSNVITINTVAPVTPAVSISATATTICTGTSVTFTATPTNGGGSPSYQWFRNGSPVGSGGNTYSTSTLNNGDIVSCILTSSLGCVTSSTANSNSISITVNPTVITSISITSTQGTSVCDGQSVSFTATPINGGTPTYQWYVNSSPVGTNSSTYVTSTLTNGSVVYCTMTSSLSCPSPATANSNSITMTVNGNVTPTCSITANPGNTICGGTNITFTASITHGGASPTYEWFVNGSPVGTNSPTYSTTTLTNGNTVYCVVTSSTPCVTGPIASSNVITMNVTTPVAPSISISASATSICPGTTINFTSTVTNGGASPVYQWTVNGSNVGTNSSTYSSSTLTNGDVVMCTLGSSVLCVTSGAVNSNGITITVNPNTISSVSISSSAGSTICSGTSVTFTATPVNGGTPTYQWLVNGSPVGTNSSTFTTSSLNNNDVVTCDMTSSLPCNAPFIANSNAISMTVNSSVAPSVSITSSQGTSICSGANVTFTATPTNGGLTPSYQWYLNGSPVGTNSTVYNNNSLVNGDVVTCVLTSSATCPTTTTATSNAITISVTSPVTPLVSISSSATTICSGTNITFTATPTNGGVTPSYQWSVNGSPVGTNSSSYSSSTIANGDAVTCVMTSALSCVTASTANSNSITITVNPSVTASVSIASSTGSTICAGTSVTFTATPVNGGAPTYQWLLNGSPVGTNSSTYSNASLNNGDVVSCQMSSSLGCALPATANSNLITMTVNSIVTPTIAISSSQGSTICAGSNVSFTASVTNGGVTPTFQWLLNGNPVGINSANYSNTTLANGDEVSCNLTSSATCPSTTTVTSNTITFSVTSPVTPTISIASSATTICAGTSVTFTATSTNGGATPTYQWMVNGSPVGSNSATYSTSTLNNGDVVTCTLTSSLTCITASTANSNSVTVTVNSSMTTSVMVTSSVGSTICAGTSVTFTATPTNGGTPDYQWYLNGSPVGTNSSTYTTSGLNNGDIVSCEMTSSLACANPATASSNAITMTVNSTATPTISIASNQGNNICDATNVTFTSTITNGGSTPSYQWMLNGSPVGTNSSTYSNSAITNGDVVTCILSSSATCPSSTTVNSNPITFTVSPNVTTSVSIGTTSTTICSGTSVTFTATPTNGGTPTYQWYVNSSPVGTNSATFTTTTLSNGNIVSCEMTSSIACASPSPAISNTITMTVNSSATPTITITSNPTSPTICSGTNVTFTASITNGGTAPSYQWFLNGSPVGTNSSTYSNATLNTGDAVTCQLTSNAPCISVTTVLSNAITKTVNPSVTPTITITSNPTMPVCTQQSVTFTATITDGGTSPSYQWKKNGQNYGTGGSTYSTTLWSDGDVFTCVLTSNATCATTTTVTSNAITASIVTIDVSTTVSGNTITANQAGATYQWFDCTTQQPIAGATQQSYTANATGLYGVYVTVGSCTAESGCDFIDYNSIYELSQSGIVLYPNPTSNYFTLQLPKSAHMQMTLYDVAGRIVQVRELNGMNHQIDVHELATGSYQLVLQDGNNQFIGKVLIHRQ